jgi:Flp pilus assembly protein TadG
MLLAPCTAVHTIGMRFPIDVVFVDRQGYAVKIVRNLRPWRMALATGGRAVIEMAAGSLGWGQVLPGDRLYLAPVSAAERDGESMAPTSAGTPEDAPAVVAAISRRADAPAPTRSFVGRLRDTAGTSIVEAAIITPLLLLLTFSIADFGAMFYVYLELENGVAQASRYGVTGNLMNDPSSPGNQLSRADSIKTAMRQATPTLTLQDSAFSFSFMPPGGTSWSSGTGGPGDIGKVTVDYNWTLMTPLLRPFFPPNGQFHITVASAMKNEARFQ